MESNLLLPTTSAEGLEYISNYKNINNIYDSYSESQLMDFFYKFWIKDKAAVTELFVVAAKNSNKKIIKETIKHGADINFTDETGKTALHKAIERNSNLLLFLLENGADANHNQSHLGNTILSCAINSRSSESIGILLDFQATEYRSTPVTLNLLLSKVQSGGDIHPNRNKKRLEIIFLKYIIKRYHANFAVDRKCYETTKVHAEWIPITQEILEEIDLMKVYEIGTTHTTYYDVFIALHNHRRLIDYMNIPEIKNILELPYWISHLPYYCYVIKNAIIKAKQRQLILNHLHSNSNLNFNLPIVCLDKLFSYLSNDDLKTLIKAYE